MQRRELILYATPTGPLAEACDLYYQAVTSEHGLGPTVAQAYPAHCTLTGFFHRAVAGSHAEAVITAMTATVTAAGPVPGGAVKVVDLVATDEWVGLTLDSPWLIDLTAQIINDHRLPVWPTDDPLRPKHDLHLSLAYGTPNLAPYAQLARELVDPSAPTGWEVAVWERQPAGSWLRH